MRHACALLACVASASALTASTNYRHSIRTHPPPVHQTLLVASREEEQEDPESTSYCISVDGQTMVDDKWCVVSCSNVPPNCPGDLCDCAKGREAKKRYDIVQEILKNATKPKEEPPATKPKEEPPATEHKEEPLATKPKEEALATKPDEPLISDRTTPFEDGETEQPVHREQAVHQRELKQGTRPDSAGLPGQKTAASSVPKSAAEVKWEEQSAAWAVRDSPPMVAEKPENTNADNAVVAAPDLNKPLPSLADMVDQIANEVAAKEMAASETSTSSPSPPMPFAATQDAARNNYGQQEATTMTTYPTANKEPKDRSIPRGGTAGDVENYPLPIHTSLSRDGGKNGAQGETKSESQEPAAEAASSNVSADAGPNSVSGSKSEVENDPTSAASTEAKALSANATALFHEFPSEAPGETTLFSDIVNAVAQSVVDKSLAKEKATMMEKAKRAAENGAKDATTSEPEDPAAGANLTTNSTTDCPKCSFPANSPDVPNCCSKEGAWAGTCIAVATEDAPSWEDGFNACRSLSAARKQLATKQTTTKSGATKAAPNEAKEGLSQDDKNKNVLSDVIGAPRKCDSEREEWCDGGGKSALPEGADPKDCIAAGDSVGIDDQWCITNCGFNPPNCPVAMCKCAKAGANASENSSRSKKDDVSSLSPFAKAFERRRKDNNEVVSDMVSKREKALRAKEAEQAQATDGNATGTKSDKEIYLETCEKHPTTKGCPTCEEVPSMPHCGLNASSWQDVSGLPDGADPASCASVGDVTKEWCVLNCGGTPPNCPSSLCKCKAPAGKQDVQEAQPTQQQQQTPSQQASQQQASQQQAAEQQAAEQQQATEQRATKQQASQQQVSQQQEAWREATELSKKVSQASQQQASQQQATGQQQAAEQQTTEQQATAQQATAQQDTAQQATAQQATEQQATEQQTTEQATKLKPKHKRQKQQKLRHQQVSFIKKRKHPNMSPSQQHAAQQEDPNRDLGLQEAQDEMEGAAQRLVVRRTLLAVP